MRKKRNEINRRQFLSTSAMAALGVASHSFFKTGPLGIQKKKKKS